MAGEGVGEGGLFNICDIVRNYKLDIFDRGIEIYYLVLDIDENGKYTVYSFESDDVEHIHMYDSPYNTYRRVA